MAIILSYIVDVLFVLSMFVAVYRAGRRAERKDDANRLSKIFEEVKAEVAPHKMVIEELHKMSKAIEDNFKSQGLVLSSMSIHQMTHEGNIPVSSKGPVVRVYALKLSNRSNRFDEKIYAVPANTYQEAYELALAHLGPQWEGNGSSFCDVMFEHPSQILKDLEEVPVPKEKNLQSFVADIKYCRDNFAKTAVEKKILEAVIKNIEQSYANKKI